MCRTYPKKSPSALKASRRLGETLCSFRLIRATRNLTHPFKGVRLRGSPLCPPVEQPRIIRWPRAPNAFAISPYSQGSIATRFICKGVEDGNFRGPSLIAYHFKVPFFIQRE